MILLFAASGAILGWIAARVAFALSLRGTFTCLNCSCVFPKVLPGAMLGRFGMYCSLLCAEDAFARSKANEQPATVADSGFFCDPSPPLQYCAACGHDNLRHYAAIGKCYECPDVRRCKAFVATDRIETP